MFILLILPLKPRRLMRNKVYLLSIKTSFKIYIQRLKLALLTSSCLCFIKVPGSALKPYKLIPAKQFLGICQNCSHQKAV